MILEWIAPGRGGEGDQKRPRADTGKCEKLDISLSEVETTGEPIATIGPLAG